MGELDVPLSSRGPSQLIGDSGLRGGEVPVESVGPGGGPFNLTLKIKVRQHIALFIALIFTSTCFLLPCNINLVDASI